MMAVYSLLLALSVSLITAAALRLDARLGPAMGRGIHTPAGMLLVLPITGFLMVVGVAAPVLMAALFLLLFGRREDRLVFRLEMRAGMLMFAVLLGLSSFAMPQPPMPFGLPVQAVIGLVYVWWLAVTASAPLLPRNLGDTVFGTVLAMLPLSLAPLLFEAAHTSIALDAGLIGAGLLPALLLAPKRAGGLSLRWPLAFLVAYLQLRCLASGAWPLALASLLVWLGMMLRGWQLQRQQEGAAFDARFV